MREARYHHAMRRWCTLLAVVGCGGGDSAPTDAAVDASACFNEPMAESSFGCVDRGLEGFELAGTWHVSGEHRGLVAPGLGHMEFDLTFVPGQGHCYTATSTQDPSVSPFWPDPSGGWYVDLAAAYGNHSTTFTVSAKLCISNMTSLPTLTLDSWETSTNGHEPIEGREHFDGTLSR
jgi:hypothetical protein